MHSQRNPRFGSSTLPILLLALLALLPTIVSAVPAATLVSRQETDHDHGAEAAAAAAGGDAGAAGAAGEGSQDACQEVASGEYDLNMHIASIFIIMGLSFIGTMLPIVAKRFTSLKVKQLPFQSIKLFGAGVILATAFVHMFTPANEQLTNPCLPQVFQDYGAWAGALALLGVLTTHLFQVLAGLAIRKNLEKKYGPKPVTATTVPATVGDVTANHSHEIVDAEKHVHAPDEDHAGHSHALSLNADKHVTTYILEAGIASHSIIIGVTLGAARDEFKTLFIALLFHQFFEGIALSSVVMETEFKKKITALVMVIFYTLTTPIGIAIGIALRESYAENATHALITTGVLDALSAGILLYDG
ncbi:hypothetical protein HK104_007385, partial [Borealophlyctis nickersoniae]